MIKALKWISIVIGTIILLLIVASIILANVISPKEVVVQIDKQLYAKTGHHLIIKGKASWSFFPWLGFNASHIEITNSPGFGSKPLASVGDLQVKVKLMPLFSRQVQVGNVVVKNAVFNLVTNKAGQSNWQSLINAKSTGTNTKPDHSTADKVAPLAISITKIDIDNANVFMTDQKNNTITKFEKFNLQMASSGDLNNIAIKSSLQMSSNQSTNINQISFTGHAKANAANQKINISDFNLQSNTLRKDLPTLKLTLTGDLLADNKTQTITLNKMRVSIANLVLNGTAKVFNYNATPSYRLQFTSNAASVAQLTQTLTGKSSASGNIKLSTNVTTSGSNQAQLIKNMNGSGQFSLSNVALGSQLNQFIDDGIKRANRNANTTAATKYVSVWGNYTINNGIFNNSNLSTSLKNPVVNGGGQINLLTQAISYRLTASTTISIDKNQIPITFPVYIGGTISNPTYRADTGAIATQIATYLAKGLIQNQLKKVFEGGNGKNLPIKVPFFGR